MHRPRPSTHTRTHTFSQTRARTHTHMHTFSHIHTHTHTRAHSLTDTCTRTHTRTQSHTLTHTCTHTHTRPRPAPAFTVCLASITSSLACCPFVSGGTDPRALAPACQQGRRGLRLGSLSRNGINAPKIGASVGRAGLETRPSAQLPPPTARAQTGANGPAPCAVQPHRLPAVTGSPPVPTDQVPGKGGERNKAPP